MLSYLSLFGSLVAVVGAWMPVARNMTARDGNNLFESRQSYFSNEHKRWLPNNLPIRGVNLGSMFVVEPWMASTEWSNVLNCGDTGSEFDCVSMLGQSQADTNWANHWSSFITESDLDTMSDYSLNTIRIPVGYWIWESLKYDR